MEKSEEARWFAEKVQPHESTLRGYLHSVATVTDVDDVVQETYARLLRAREQGSVRSVRGLLFATARNVARDLFRRRAVAKNEPTLDDGIVDDAPAVSEVVSRRQEVALSESAIRDLPERCRVILVLRRFEHLSHKEIAARLGIAEHTVEAQLTKGLRRCEEFFQKHGALPRK